MEVRRWAFLARPFGLRGHSHEVVDPWGEIIAEAENKEIIMNCEIDLDKVEEYQKSIPVLNHDIDF